MKVHKLPFSLLKVYNCRHKKVKNKYDYQLVKYNKKTKTFKSLL